ncbi:hypothetical protein EUTSA_v10009934mg, partial [Eutrema salsugineum]
RVGKKRESKATSLPLDLIFEILERLPAKSAVKFRCVSKLWSSITTLPSFIRSFDARSSATGPRLLIVSRTDKYNQRFVFSIPQNQNSDNQPVVDSYEMTIPTNYCLSCTDSVHGLICITRPRRVEIWNPTMRRVATLPRPKTGGKDTHGFLGYDPIDGTYKVLCMPTFHLRHKGKYQPLVFTLGGAQDSWRVIHGVTEHYPLQCGKCINGVVYYVASLEIDGAAWFLVSFHVRSEKMSMIQVPWSHNRGFLSLYQGKLARVTSNADDITMWILEDAEKHEWSCKHFHLPFPSNDPVSNTFLRLKGVNDADELIYVPRKLVNPFHILYYHPGRNSFRRVIVDGVADEQFMRRNGLDDKTSLITISAYSNHIDTLLSF